jgi:hypothetical protein
MLICSKCGNSYDWLDTQGRQLTATGEAADGYGAHTLGATALHTAKDADGNVLSAEEVVYLRRRKTWQYDW